MTKRTRTHSRIESLEARIAPATLNIAFDGTATYTGGVGAASFLTLTSLVPGRYEFSDVENITVTGPGAGFATGSGTSTVSLDNSATTSLVFNLGDQDDILLIHNLGHPLTVNDGAGNDTVRLETNPLFPSDDVSVAAETVNIDSALTVSGFNSATFTADKVAIGASGAVNALQQVTFKPLTPGRGINLGTENGAQLSLTDAELDRVSTARLQIGAADSGSIELSAAITPANLSVTTMNTGADVLTTGGGAWISSVLAVTATGNVALTGPNNLNGFAMSAAGSGTSTLNEVDGFSVTSTYSVAGISNANGTTQIVTPGGVLGSYPIVTPNLRLTGGGNFALSAVTNTIGTLAANTTQDVLVRNSSPLTIGTVGGITGVTAENVEFTAPDMAINAPINVGTGDAYFFPSNNAFIVDLAGSGGANTFALSIAELGAITAGRVFIGTDANAMNIGNVFSLSGSLRVTASSISGPGGIVVPTLTISSPDIQLGGSNNVSTLILDSSAPITAFTFNGGDNFTIGAVNPGTPLSLLTGANLSLPNGIITLGPDAQFVLGIGAGGAAQIAVTGELTLNTQLRFNQTGALPFATTFNVLTNDGSDAINGTFDGLPEGALVPGINPPARISYIGGDGNDVTIQTAEALTVDIATDGKSATFRDLDGDLVSVKTTAGTFTPASFSGY